MRVALVFKRYARTGGSERQLAMLARHLVEHGDAVHVFCASVRAPADAGVMLHRMPAVPFGHTAQLVAFSRWARLAIGREERLDGPFDLRHAFGRTLGQDVYRLGGGCHRTYLEHAHARDRPAWARTVATRMPYQALKARMEEQAITACTTRLVITNSAMVADDVADRYGLGPDRLAVVRNGVDLEHFRPGVPGEREALRSELGLSASDPVALFLGTGYARKGLDVALRALERLRSRLPKLRLLVAGADRREDSWRRLAAHLGLSDAVRFLGPRPDPERLYRAADVFVLPTAYDASANATLEALASGLPVVTTMMDGGGEILDPAIHGTVVPTPAHPDDVAEALAHWLAVADQSRIRHACRARASQHPSGAAARRIRELYLALLDAGTTPVRTASHAGGTPSFAK